MAQISRTLTVIAILVFALQAVVHADVYVNFSNGNDSASGTISDPFKTLRRALDTDESTIYLAGVTGQPGDCSLVISKSVKIISQGAEMNCREGLLQLVGQDNEFTNEFTLDGFNSIASLQVTKAKTVTISNSIFHGLVIDRVATQTRISNVTLSGRARFLFSDSSRQGEVSLSQVRSSCPDDLAFYFLNADAQLLNVSCTKVTSCIQAQKSTVVAHRISYTVQGGIMGVKGIDSWMQIYESTFSGLAQAIQVTGPDSADSKSSLQVYRSVFSGNGFNGLGADIGSQSSSVFVEENTFLNSVALKGGSIYHKGSQMLIAHRNFWSNSTVSEYGAVAFRVGDGKSEFVGNHVENPYCVQYKTSHGYVFELSSSCMVSDNTYCKVPMEHWPGDVVRPCRAPSSDDENCHPDPPVTTSVTTTGLSTTSSSTTDSTNAATSSAPSITSSGSSTTGSGSNSGRYTGLLIVSLVVCLAIIAVLVVVNAKLTVCAKDAQSRLYEPIA